MARAINYREAIGESEGALLALESVARSKVETDRVRMLRLLQSGHGPNVSQVAAVLGYTVRTVQAWWWRYRDGGLKALLPSGNRGGAPERMTEEAWTALSEEMTAGRIGSLEAARVYLRDQWRIDYSVDGLSKLFKRRKAKLKTGRLRHRKAASPDVQAAFKKEAPGHSRREEGGSCLCDG